MNEQQSASPPSADDIERLFGHPIVRTARPAVLGGLEVLKRVRRFDWRSVGLEQLERVEGPFVFAANHRSHADTAGILGVLPRAIRNKTAVAAALDVFGTADHPAPSMRRRLLPLTVAAGFHAFAFDRHGSPMRSVRTAVQLIRNGWSLLIYPEGTRSRNGRIADFKAGIGVIARFSGRPVIPVHVSQGEAVLPPGVFLPRTGRMTVRFAAPMTYDRAESPEDFVARLEAEVRRLEAISDAVEGVPEPPTDAAPQSSFGY